MMKPIHAVAPWLIGLALAGLPAQAQEHAAVAPSAHPTVWTSQPMLQAAGRPGQRGTVPFVVTGFAADSLLLFAPEDPARGVPQRAWQGHWPVMPDAGRKGGFHWLTAESHPPGQVIRASTAWSFPGQGPSPEKLLQASASGLDLRPLRLSERGGYREASRWVFRLTWDTLPLANHEVLLETENGSRQIFRSDAAGEVAVIFPRDYAEDGIDPELGAARTRKAYLLSATRMQDDVRHTSTFGHYYSPDLLRERSLGWGTGFAVLGMLLALPLLKRQEKKT